MIATDPRKHFELAREALMRNQPVLVEKPVSFYPCQAWELVDLDGIAFAGHTRLYSPTWRKFKEWNFGGSGVKASAGGTRHNPLWDWGPHLAAMCLDIGIDPKDAEITCTKEPQPLRFEVNGDVFTDVEGERPLDVLLTEFADAIEYGKPNNAGLELGARVIDYLWSRNVTR